ncbi:hypothetical protein HGRIS_004303 [Hohenbuehelia grisea]|uniref:Uncharacterized protein n=1 Tax=Hohenbuehelia grisea TaxID=104357 RepID=A0ABR3IPD1_9AGAR
MTCSICLIREVGLPLLQPQMYAPKCSVGPWFAVFVAEAIRVERVVSSDAAAGMSIQAHPLCCALFAVLTVSTPSLHAANPALLSLFSKRHTIMPFYSPRRQHQALSPSVFIANPSKAGWGMRFMKACLEDFEGAFEECAEIGEDDVEDMLKKPQEHQEKEYAEQESQYTSKAKATGRVAESDTESVDPMVD